MSDDVSSGGWNVTNVTHPPHTVTTGGYDTSFYINGDADGIADSPEPNTDDGYEAPAYSNEDVDDTAIDTESDVIDGYENPTYTASDETLENGSAPVQPEEAAIEMDDDEAAAAKLERKRLREVLYFQNDPDKRIDYVIAYEDTEDEGKSTKRDTYIANLKKQGMLIEEENKKDSVDGRSNFYKLHVTWKTLTQVAELLYLPKRIKMPKSLEEELTGCCHGCLGPCEVGQPFIEEEDDYFTAEFDAENLDMFDIDWDNKENFFTNAERSLVAKEVLDRTAYTPADETTERFGINRLIKDGVFKAAYPLHEGHFRPLPDEEEPYVGRDKDRERLYEAWARPGRWWTYQPLDLVRKYFGEKVGIYFAWLGFYTTMLIPAAIAGLAVFIFGCVTIFDYTPSEEICTDSEMGLTTMCPECDEICDYYVLGDSCLYSRITYLFDNFATVVFAGFMSIWATFFLEFWKRYQKSLEYDWDVADFEFEEPMRPEYEFKVKRRRKNPVTLIEEPDMGWYERLPRICTSFVGVMVMIVMVLGAILGVIIYRIIIVFLFYQVQSNETFARLATSVTASVINFIAIIILNFIYTKIATALTELETPRTWTEYEDSYTFKMYLFQFVNYYGTVFYIAFFKGSFVTYPGDNSNYLFGEWKQDTCDPSGCLVDLFIQLATVMVLKQILNNLKELFLPKLMACYRTKKSLKGETDENLYMRWEQDLDLGDQPILGLFEEYLEMVIQFGFVTIFVAAFPLAPLFALINNVVEIRLDAYKFVTVWRRAPALKAQDIGIWYSILESIAFMSIVTNAFIMGHTSDFVPKMVYFFGEGQYSLSGYINSSLSYYAIADFPAESAPVDSAFNSTTFDYCRFRGYYEFPGTQNEYEYTKQYWIIFTARLAFVIVFEHAVFVITYIVAAMVPDTPASVKRLQLYERELVKKLRFDATFKEENAPGLRKSSIMEY